MWQAEGTHIALKSSHVMSCIDKQELPAMIYLVQDTSHDTAHAPEGTDWQVPSTTHHLGLQ